MNKGQKIIGRLFILMSAALFGFSYTANKLGGGQVAPAAYVGLRSILGAVILFPIVVFSARKKSGADETEKSDDKQSLKYLIFGGIICGIILFLGLFLSVLGVQYSEVSKAGFITVLYIVVVPLVGMLRGKRVGLQIWCGVVIAVIGFYFLSMSESLTITKGDFIILISMFMFAFHIVALGIISPKVNGIALSFLQYLVGGIIGIAYILIEGNINLSQIQNALPAILYAGIMGTGLGFTLQTIGQAWVEPAIVSLLLSTESLFALLGGYIILKESLTPRELMGGLIVLIGVLLAQFDFKLLKRGREDEKLK